MHRPLPVIHQPAHAANRIDATHSHRGQLPCQVGLGEIVHFLSIDNDLHFVKHYIGTMEHPRPFPPKYYRAAELAQAMSLTRQTVHNYTLIGLIQEEKRTPGGHRLYSEDAVVRLRVIKELKAAGLPFPDIARRMRDQEAPPTQADRP